MNQTIALSEQPSPKRHGSYEPQITGWMIVFICLFCLSAGKELWSIFNLIIYSMVGSATNNFELMSVLLHVAIFICYILAVILILMHRKFGRIMSIAVSSVSGLVVLISFLGFVTSVTLQSDNMLAGGDSGTVSLVELVMFTIGYYSYGIISNVAAVVYFSRSKIVKRTLIR